MDPSVIAVDCGGTNLACARVRRTALPGGAELSGRAVRRTPRRAAALPAAIVRAIAPLLVDSVVAVGIGAAGLVDHTTGRLVWSPHAAGHDVAVREEVEAAVGRPVVVDNDNNLAAWAEARLGAGRGHRVVLYVAVGTGIGAGLVIDGRLERGRRFLGEVGHMTLEREGPACPCGKRGCWEALVSGTSLGRAAQQAAAEDPGGLVARLASGRPARGEHLTAAAERGDAAAQAAVSAAGSWLGLGLANLVQALDPDVIVMGGGVSRAGEVLFGPARRAMAASVAGARYREPTPVRPARFGIDAGLIGAALAAEEGRW